MLEQSMDFRNGLVRLCYNPTFGELRGPYVNETLPPKLQEFSKFLGERSWFAGGDDPTVVDFIMYELLDQHRELAPDKVAIYGNIMDFLKRFEKLPKIEAYMR